MNRSPKVTAVVVNWNQRDLTIECITSLLDSDYDNLDIILIDNGSKDDSVKVIRESFCGVRIISNESNLGFAEGNNRGIAAALDQKSDYVLFLNNDATVAPDCIAKLVNVIEANSDTGAVTPYIFYHDDRDLIWYGGGIVRLWRGKIAHLHLREKQDMGSRNVQQTDYFSGCAALVKADLIREIGGFDPIYGMYSEDVDLSLRIRENGHQILVIPKAKAYHRVSVSAGGEISPLKAFHRGRSAVLLVKRWSKLWHLPTLIIGGFLGAIYISLKLILKGKIGTVSAIWQGLFVGLIGSSVPQKFQLEYMNEDFDARTT